jgi:hypothetical protein
LLPSHAMWLRQTLGVAAVLGLTSVTQLSCSGDPRDQNFGTEAGLGFDAGAGTGGLSGSGGAGGDTGSGGAGGVTGSGGDPGIGGAAGGTGDQDADQSTDGQDGQ